jgi:predicted  nucleic acid-binding Zn-ribbon protein
VKRLDRELLTAIAEMLDKKLDEKLEPIKQDVSGLKQDMTGVKQDVSGLKQDMTGVKQDVSGLKQDMTGVKSQQWEDHEIIKALMHASEVDGAKLDALKWDVAHVEGRMAGIEEKVGCIDGRLTNIESDVKEIKTEVGSIQDAQREFYEMYGEQETKIRVMQRKLASS